MNRMLPRRARRGFSLIELLIVVAIIAALVGVAVPFFQDNLSEAQKTKAAQDLEVIKKAIALYDAREPRPLTGTDLKPLLGRYMQELPKDPWGNDYLFDGAMGFLCSFGADALPRGTGGDTDIVVRTKPELMISRAQYQGSWGRPKPRSPATQFSTGNKFIISLTKPCGEGTAALATALSDTSDESIDLLRNLTIGGGTNPGDGTTLETAPGWAPNTFRSAAMDVGNVDPLHRPETGVLVFYCAVDESGDPTAQGITPTMAVDFAGMVKTNALPSPSTYIESNIQNAQPKSPMDTAVYGTAAYTEYRLPPKPVELVDGQRRGVRIEKY